MLSLPFYIGEHVIANLEPRLGRCEPLNRNFCRNAPHAFARAYRSLRRKHPSHMVGERDIYGRIHAKRMDVTAWDEHRIRRIAGGRPRQKPANALEKR